MDRKAKIYLAVLVITIWGACAATCEKKDKPGDAVPHDRDIIGSAASRPATAEEAVALQIKYDESRAEIARLQSEKQAALDALHEANAATWKRFGAYSWMCVVPGLAILIGGFMPIVGAFLAPAHKMGMLLLAAGMIFAIVPHMLATYGPVVFYPTFGAAAVFIVGYLGLELWKRYKAIRDLSTKAVNSDNPTEMAKHASAAVALARATNPAIDKAFKKNLTNTAAFIHKNAT